jgi:class 3 adenylate cyclase/pimeloyl-ACP methyl ester carboxylesterase
MWRAGGVSVRSVVPDLGSVVKTQTVTILFCDLVASTERRARLGDDAFDAFTYQFLSALREVVAAHEGREVKTAGDGMMVAFSESAADAVACSTAMHRAVAALDPHDPPQLRIGISSGEVAQDGNDFSGMPIVEAARLEATAAPGQTLANAVVRTLVGTRRAFRFRDVGALTLKGIPTPLATVEIADDEVADVSVPPPPILRRAVRPARRRWPIVVAVVALAVVCAVAAVAITTGGHAKTASPAVPVASGYTPRFEPKPCPANFLKQVPNGTCGVLSVPEDRANPHGRWLHLLITRAPERTTSPAADPTISIDSGLAPDDPATSPARDHSELISITTRFWDYYSTDVALACPEFEPIASQRLTRPPKDRTLVGAGQHALRACHDRLTRTGVALSRYTAEDAGNDVVDLIRALHVPRVNLVAANEKTPVALAVARDHPELVRTLTLLNPYPIVEGLADPTAQLAGAFDRYVALCNADPRCVHAYPNLARMARQDWAEFNAHPQLINAVDLNTGRRHAILLNGDRLDNALAATIGTENGPRIAAGIANPPIGLTADLALTESVIFYEHNFAWASFLGNACSHDLFTLSPGTPVSSRIRPELAGLDDGFIQWACAAWSVPKAPNSTFQNVASPTPTLLIVTPLFPLSSPDVAATLAAALPDASLLTLPTLGFDALQGSNLPCLNQLRRNLLADPKQHLDTTACAKQSPPIDFITSTP